MSRTLGTLVTITTYGTWLRGDRRGWVDEGRLMPPQPRLEAADTRRMKHPPYYFDVSNLIDVGRVMGESLTTRLDARVLGLCVGVWHAHFVVGPTPHDIGEVVKCAKDAVRYGLRPGRPIWTDGYDKRFCFDESSLRNRIRYVERHNEALGWPSRPWGFITAFGEI